MSSDRELVCRTILPVVSKTPIHRGCLHTVEPQHLPLKAPLQRSILPDPPEPMFLKLMCASAAIHDERWVNVGSFHQKAITAFRQLAPEISTAASQLDVAALFFARRLPEKFRQALLDQSKGQVLQIPTSWKGLALDSSNFIQFVQQQDRRVMYWTINDSDNMRMLLSRGANGLVSDNVNVARQAIDQFIEQRSK